MKLLPFLPFAFIYSIFYYLINRTRTKKLFKSSLLFDVKNYFNIFKNTLLPFPELKGRVKFSFSEDFLKIAGRRSVIMITLHFGIWEYLPSIFSKLGYKTGIFVSNYKSGLYKKIVDLIRSNMGISFYRKITNIGNNSLIGFTLDNIRKKAVKIDGIRFSQIPFILSKRYEIPVIPVAGWREKGHFVVETGDEVGSLYEGVEWLMKRVYQKPEQYLWVGK